MSAFKIGDIVIAHERRVFRVQAIARGVSTIPDGWLYDKHGTATNPNFCRHYKGALSVLPDDI